MNRKLAKKLNANIIKSAKTPHERDIARMRLNIIKQAKARNKQHGDK
ncbi:MAG: hypothetical protein QXI16_02685 [Sulfolobaceae archaeon]